MVNLPWASRIRYISHWVIKYQYTVYKCYVSYCSSDTYSLTNNGSSHNIWNRI